MTSVTVTEQVAEATKEDLPSCDCVAISRTLTLNENLFKLGLSKSILASLPPTVICPIPLFPLVPETIKISFVLPPAIDHSYTCELSSSMTLNVDATLVPSAASSGTLPALLEIEGGSFTSRSLITTVAVV